MSENLPNGKLDIGANFGKYGFTITKQKLEEKEDNVSAYVLQRHSNINCCDTPFIIHNYHFSFLFWNSERHQKRCHITRTPRIY